MTRAVDKNVPEHAPQRVLQMEFRRIFHAQTLKRGSVMLSQMLMAIVFCRVMTQIG
jgi:hypothetical protein